MYWLSTLLIAWLTWPAAASRCPVSGDRIEYISLARKRSEFKLWFLMNAYGFCLIVTLENHPLNHHEVKDCHNRKSKFKLP